MINKELQRQRFKRYYFKHKEKIKARRAKYHKIYRSKNAGNINAKSRIYRLKRLYGITPQQYDKMLDQQNGFCKICFHGSSKLLCVDHDHRTGEVRGLLCHNCNNALGLLAENTAILQNMIRYIEVHKGEKNAKRNSRCSCARRLPAYGRSS